MTKQVMAALKDPFVKNKVHMITKICDGSVGSKNRTLPKKSSERDDILAQYLAHHAEKSKPKSQAVTARSKRTKRRPTRNHANKLTLTSNSRSSQNSGSPSNLY